MREPQLILPSGPYSGNPLLLLLDYPLLDLSRIPTASMFVFCSPNSREWSFLRSLNKKRKVDTDSVPPSCVAPYKCTTPDQVCFFAALEWWSTVGERETLTQHCWSVQCHLSFLAASCCRSSLSLTFCSTRCRDLSACSLFTISRRCLFLVASSLASDETRKRNKSGVRTTCGLGSSGHGLEYSISGASICYCVEGAKIKRLQLPRVIDGVSFSTIAHQAVLRFA